MHGCMHASLVPVWPSLTALRPYKGMSILQEVYQRWLAQTAGLCDCTHINIEQKHTHYAALAQIMMGLLSLSCVASLSLAWLLFHLQSSTCRAVHTESYAHTYVKLQVPEKCPRATLTCRSFRRLTFCRSCHRRTPALAALPCARELSRLSCLRWECSALAYLLMQMLSATMTLEDI
eukprot:6482290-Amphidinium_carterae.3